MKRFTRFAKIMTTAVASSAIVCELKYSMGVMIHMAEMVAPADILAADKIKDPAVRWGAIAIFWYRNWHRRIPFGVNTSSASEKRRRECRLNAHDLQPVAVVIGRHATSFHQ